MSLERKRRALELLEGALAEPREARATFLDEECGDDPELRREVESLLDTDGGAGILAEPAFSVHAEDAGVGRRIGPYRLIALIDRGGMGSVYLAEREDFEQRVALKLIRRGLDADEMLVRRFENERQILARLEHPHIARLLDGGTTADRLPYFVMEYVEGEPIDRYCQTRGLSIDARLELFRRVCSAVQFAHQNLVIHRDLKPSNILITADGHPRLLDFGIAKLLDDSVAARAVETVLGQGPMTPRYASPEQIRLEPVTTASDVYALGVLLYELLTGLDPYGVAGGRSDEVARAVCEREPDRPSTAVRRRAPEPEGAEARRLRHRLAGDLDSIVLKAMRKEPRLRYASAEQLSDDIRRHLEGLPVDAQTGTFVYRAGKLVRRHKVAMAIIAGFVILISSFAVVATVLWQRAEHEREGAVIAFRFLENLFKGADPDQTRGAELTALELLERSREKVAEELKDQPERQIEVAGILGEIYRKLGAYDEAKEMIELSLEVAREHYGGDHAAIVDGMSNLAVLLHDDQDYPGAEALFRQALEMGRGLDLPAEELEKIQGNLATTLLLQNQYERAEAVYLDVLNARLARAKGPDDTDVATSRRNLAALYFAWRKLDKAESLLTQALEARQRAYGPENTLVASVRDLLGSVLAEDPGRRDEAERLYREALGVRMRLLGDEHRDVARTRKNLAALLAHHDPEAARELLEPALETFRQDVPDGWQVAEAESVLGEILTEQGRYDEAEPHLVGGFERLRDLRGAEDFRTHHALERIIDLYQAWGKEEELERYRALR